MPPGGGARPASVLFARDDVRPERSDLVRLQQTAPGRHRVLAPGHGTHEPFVLARWKFSQIESSFRIFHPHTVTRRAVLCVKRTAALDLFSANRSGVRCIGSVRETAGREQCNRDDELLHLDYESVA